MPFLFKRLIIVFIVCFTLSAKAQLQNDSVFVRSVVEILTAPSFHGRGYVYNGMQQSATYLQKQFQSLQLRSFDSNSYLQPFEYPVNIFPGKMKVRINRHLLTPGEDYIVSPDSRGARANCSLEYHDSIHFSNPQHRISVTLADKLTWSVAAKQSDHTTILLNKKAVSQTPRKIKVDIENKFAPHFQAANVCGYVKGSVYPDSVIFITAHYDHLGRMGKHTYFPGANDNASGIGLLLALAKYYTAYPQPYSIGFICFAGEEAGLRGSLFFTEHPLMPLQKIRFLINLDLVGTGEDGITVVNATTHPEAFEMLQQINTTGQYISAVHSRDKAANSDHYWFSEKGVPAFFIYTNGGIKAYHDVYDRAATLPLTEINDLSALLKKFIGELNIRNSNR